MIFIDLLDEKGLRLLHAYGEEHEENIIRLCLVKNLIPVRPSSTVKLIDKSKSIPLIVSKDMNLLDCLNLFQAQKCHFALVPSNNNDVARIKACCSKQKNILDNITFFGIITLEDVVEEVIQEEIYDETDSSANMDVNTNTDADVDASIPNLENESINLDNMNSNNNNNNNNNNNSKRINMNIARGDYDHLCEMCANKVKNKGYLRGHCGNCGLDDSGGESLIKRIASNRSVASPDILDEIKQDTCNVNESDGYDTRQEFVSIFKATLRKSPADLSVACELLAEETHEYSGADLAGIAKVAVKLAICGTNEVQEHEIDYVSDVDDDDNG